MPIHRPAAAKHCTGCVMISSPSPLRGALVFGLLLAWTGTAHSQDSNKCGDIAGNDGLVNIEDLLAILAQYGKKCTSGPSPPPSSKEGVVWRIRVDKVHGGGGQAQTTEMALAGRGKQTIKSRTKISRSGSKQCTNCPQTCGKSGHGCGHGKCQMDGKGSQNEFACQANGKTSCSEQTNLQVGAYYEYTLPKGTTPAFLHMGHCDSNARYPKLVTVLRKVSDAKYLACDQIDSGSNAQAFRQKSQFLALKGSCVTGKEGPKPCATAKEFVVIGSTTRHDNNGKPGWFELAELRMFNSNGDNVAKKAKITLILNPKNPNDVAKIVDGKVRYQDGMLVWENKHKFHGKPLIKLTFKEDQAITGVELYTTNTESFGSNAIVRATTKPATSLPISTVFTASNNPGGPSCFRGGKNVKKPCSTADGKSAFTDPKSCLKVPSNVCATSTTFIVRGSTTRKDNNRKPGWFELAELKLFNDKGENVANKAKIVLLLAPKNAKDIKKITDGKTRYQDGMLVWESKHKFHGMPLIRVQFDKPQELTGAELYSTNYESFGTDAEIFGNGKFIPVRTVFMAHGSGNACFAGGKALRKPCSTADGQVPYVTPGQCKKAPYIVEGRLSANNAAPKMMKWKFLSGSVAPTIYDGNHKPVGGDSNGQHDDIAAVRLSGTCKSGSLAIYGKDRSVSSTDLRHIRVMYSKNGVDWKCYTQTSTPGATQGGPSLAKASTNCRQHGPSHAKSGSVFNIPGEFEYVGFALWGRTDVFEIDIHTCVGYKPVIAANSGIEAAAISKGNKAYGMLKWNFFSGEAAPTVYDGSHTPVGGDNDGQHDEIVAVQLAKPCKKSSFKIFGKDRQVKNTDLRHIRVAYSMDGKAWTCYTQSNTGSQGGTKDFKTPSTKCTEGPSHAPNGAVFNLVKPAKYVEFATWGRTNVYEVALMGCEL